MGNCSPKGTPTTAGDEISNPVLIRTHSGDTVEFKSPILAKDVAVTHYPGFQVFIQGSSTPVPDSEYLTAGKFYHLLPVNTTTSMHVLPSNREGVWKVKLVIDPKRLEEIWSDSESVEALIEKMRMAAAAAGGECLNTPRGSSRSWGMMMSRKKGGADLSHMLELPN
ncbi:hypothetical protein LINGRAHAP2_LOCUS25499 [Linum grandiflorum]